MKYFQIISVALSILIFNASAFSQFQAELVIADLDTFIIGVDTLVLFDVEWIVDGEIQEHEFMKIDINYVMHYGYQEVGEDPVFWPEPYTFVKATDLSIGDSWIGVMGGEPTFEEAVLETTITVGAGPFQSMEVEYSDQQSMEYLGSKWFCQDTGLVKWLMVESGGTGTMDLESYSIVGGYGNFPLAVGNSWHYIGSFEYPSYTAPYAEITVDGDISDWSGIEPAVEDEEGDDPTSYTGVDIRNVYIAYDDDYLYMMAEFWDGVPNPIWGQISNYAYQFHMDIDEISLVDGSIGVYYTGVNWSFSGHNLNVSNCVVGCAEVVETAIPLDNIGNPNVIDRYFLEIGTGFGYDISNSIIVNLSETSVPWIKNPVPLEPQLDQNFPNPFNSETSIKFSLNYPGLVQINIYNGMGKLVRNLMNDHYTSGTHSIIWDGLDDDGKPVANGLYFCRLQINNFSATNKMVLLK